MRARRQHSMNLVFFICRFSFSHEVSVVVINVQMQFYGIELIVVWITVAFTWLISEAMLCPTFADPAFRVWSQF